MYLIGDELTVTGLELAGLRDALVADEKNAGEMLEQAAEKSDLILITHALSEHIGEEISRIRKMDKVVVIIPDRTGGRTDISDELMREATGYDLKNRE